MYVPFENQSPETAEIGRCIDLGIHRSVVVTIAHIKPWGVTTVDASKFGSRSASTPMLPMIRFFVNGVRKDSVVPEKLMQCVKIVIRMEKEGIMTVWGVEKRVSDLSSYCWFFRGFKFLGRGYHGRELVLIGLNKPPPPLENSLASSPPLSPLSRLSTSRSYAALNLDKPIKSVSSPPLSPLSFLSTSSSYSALNLDKLIKSASSTHLTSLSSHSTWSSNSATMLDELIGSEEEDEEILEETFEPISGHLRKCWDYFDDTLGF